MPDSEAWLHLQHALVQSGYLDQKSVTDIRSQRDVGERLVDAVSHASLVIHGRRLRPEDIAVDNTELISRLELILSGRTCAVPDNLGDLLPTTAGGELGHWSKSTLSVSINPNGCNLAAGMVVAAVMGAFAAWRTASNNFFTFVVMPAGSASDFKVTFATSDVKADFRGQATGFAKPPTSGIIVFKSDHIWTFAELFSLALHEIGHGLGLHHSNRPGTTMYPWAGGAFVVDGESALRIQTLYGWVPQSPLHDRGTSDRPAVAVTRKGTLRSVLQTAHMVWKGSGSDSSIWHSEFTGAWSPQQRVPNVGCSYSPALLEIPSPSALASGLLMAWKGVGGDNKIWWSINFGNGWSPQRAHPNGETSRAPTLAFVDNRIFMAWKGHGSDVGIYWSQFDQSANDWLPQVGPIRGRGTSHSPALVGHEGRLYMFWKGVPGDVQAWYASMDVVGTTDLLWKPQRKIEYHDYQFGGGVMLAIGTSGSLAATSRGNTIVVAWKGVDDDTTIWYSILSDGEFSGQAKVPDVGTAVGPGMTTYEDRVLMAWRGVESDSKIYWSQQPPPPLP